VPCLSCAFLLASCSCCIDGAVVRSGWGWESGGFQGQTSPTMLNPNHFVPSRKAGHAFLSSPPQLHPTHFTPTVRSTKAIKESKKIEANPASSMIATQAFIILDHCTRRHNARAFLQSGTLRDSTRANTGWQRGCGHCPAEPHLVIMDLASSSRPYFD
jgi:hypothetical protein